MRRVLLPALLTAAAACALPVQAQELAIHFLDVGQGDAILLISPEGKTVLVDGGPPESSGRLLGALRRHGVTTVDLVILTHPHLDHLGGLTDVVRRHPVRFFMDPGVAHPTPAYEELLSALERRGVPVKTARRGRRIHLGGGAVLDVLWPTDPLLSGTRSDVNSNSVVLRLTYGGFTAVLTGDSEQPTEAALRARPGLPATLLKVAHHGSEHSTTPAFLSKVKPELAVVCVGPNEYGHPTRQTLRRLETIGARIYRTDLHGEVTVRTDGSRHRVETERSP